MIVWGYWLLSHLSQHGLFTISWMSHMQLQIEYFFYSDIWSNASSKDWIFSGHWSRFNIQQRESRNNNINTRRKSTTTVQIFKYLLSLDEKGQRCIFCSMFVNNELQAWVLSYSSTNTEYKPMKWGAAIKRHTTTLYGDWTSTKSEAVLPSTRLFVTQSQAVLPSAQLRGQI